MKRYFYVLIGTLLIGLSLNYFIIPNNLLIFGSDGISLLLSYITGADVYINMILLNLIVLCLSIIFLSLNDIKKYLLPSLLIPICAYLTKPIVYLFPIELPEMMLNIIASSFLISLGYSILYKQGFISSSIYLLDDIISSKLHIHFKYSFFIDIIIVTLYASLINFTYALYSLVMIIVIRYLINKSSFGINDYKMFYIITKKEEEVRNYIINDLKYELTTLDVKGGYTKKNSKILLCIIHSNDYYKLKEGIKLIDDNSFIAIVDTYDIMNKNVWRNKHEKN